MMFLESAIERAAFALHGGLEGLTRRTEDAGRVARIAALCPSGSVETIKVVAAKQLPDGGWVDTEDSLWCAILLHRDQPLESITLDALAWVASHRTTGGAWGRNERDKPRIPHTAVALRFLGDVMAETGDWLVLDRLWAADFDSDLQLTYKGGFFLSCQDLDAKPSDLAHVTLAYLHSQANQDGGFGPWRGHPIGSDPWSTGVCLAGLCRLPELANRVVIERAVQWLIDTQLPSGYWPYHFIDEGTAYAYWGLTEAVKLLEAS